MIKFYFILRNQESYRSPQQLCEQRPLWRRGDFTIWQRSSHPRHNWYWWTPSTHPTCSWCKMVSWAHATEQPHQFLSSSRHSCTGAATVVERIICEFGSMKCSTLCDFGWVLSYGLTHNVIDLIYLILVKYVQVDPKKYKTFLMYS